MKNVNQVLTVLLIMAMVLGCGSKKKAIQSEKTKVEISEDTETKTEVSEVKTEKENQVKTTDSVVEKDEKTVTRTDDQELDIEADSTGVVTVTEKRVGNVTETTFTGVKNVRVRDKSTTEEKITKERLELKRVDSINRIKTDSINLLVEENKRLNAEITAKKDSKEKEEESGFGFFFFGFWILLLLVVAYLVYKYRKRAGFF